VTAQRIEGTLDIDHDFERTPCRILVSGQTLELLEDLYETESVGQVSLKGKHEKVSAYRVLRKARERVKHFTVPRQ